MNTASGNAQKNYSHTTRSGIFRRARAVVWTALFVVFAVTGNALNIDLFFGVNFLFGTVFVWLCLAFLGPIPAAITAALSATYTVYLWGHYYALLIFSLEFAFVLAAGGARNPSRISLLLVLFWLLIGAPTSYACYKLGLSLPTTTVNTVVAKQVLNSLVNASIAILIYNLVAGMRLSRAVIDRLNGHRELAEPSYAGVAQASIMLLVMMPVGATEILAIRKAFDARIDNAVYATTSTANHLRERALPHLEMETMLWGMYFRNPVPESRQPGTENLEGVANQTVPESIFRINRDGSLQKLSGNLQVSENDEVLPGQSAVGLLNSPTGFAILGCHTNGVLTSYRETALGSVLVFLWSPSNLSELAPDDRASATEVTCSASQFPNEESGVTKIVRPLDNDLPALISWLGASVVSVQNLTSEGFANLKVEMKLRPEILEFQGEYAAVILRLTINGVIVILFAAAFSQGLHRWLNRYAREAQHFVESGKVSERALYTKFIEDKHAVEWVRKLELVLREKEKSQVLAMRNFHELVRASNAPIFATDNGGRVQVWNETMEKVTGFKFDEVVGLPISELVTGGSSGDANPFSKEMLSNHSEAFEFSIRARNERTIFLLGGRTIIQDFSSAVSGCSEESRSEDAQLNYFTAQDLTESKAAQNQLLQSARLAALGEMAATFAHELNQPLNTISLAAGNGRAYLDLGEKGAEKAMEKFCRIEDQAIRAGEIIQTIRGFVLDRTGNESSKFDAVNSFKDAVDLLAEQIRVSSTKIELSFPGTPVILEGRSMLFEQGIIAILSNAIQALASNPSGQRLITVRTENIGRSACFHSCVRRKRGAAQEPCDSAIKFIITDSGDGIPDTIIDRIFEPFISTKSKQGGTGIGLYLAHSAFEAMGGCLRARNTSVGAEFTICLPFSAGSQETLAERGDK